ncbi:hypothetical protein OHT59_01880 [Streptomyces sp. NBC_00243]|nr:hypothetical protein [Streptomyces sp. NBC_00243]WRZ17311.1 hypothetical protein OHT59_01880 [Streptomyces sp. NBC_00243]
MPSLTLLVIVFDFEPSSRELRSVSTAESTALEMHLSGQDAARRYSYRSE